MCSVQFLKHDLHIFAYNVSEYIYVKEPNKMNLYDLKLCLSIVTKGNDITKEN